MSKTLKEQALEFCQFADMSHTGVHCGECARFVDGFKAAIKKAVHEAGFNYCSCVRSDQPCTGCQIAASLKEMIK